jgi:hypothetical protein
MSLDLMAKAIFDSRTAEGVVFVEAFEIYFD